MEAIFSRWPYFLESLLLGAVTGAVVGAVQNRIQGDDVVKSAKGGLAGGIATVVMTWITALAGGQPS